MRTKIIKNFSNYQISDTGEVFGPKGKLTPKDCGVGYLKVVLYNENGWKNKRIHRLVAEAFLPSWNEKLQVNHIDGNKHNNHYSNLELCTPKQNIKHAQKHGKHNYQSKPLLTEAEYREIQQRLIKGETTASLAAEFDRSLRCIQYIKQNKTKRQNFAKNRFKMS